MAYEGIFICDHCEGRGSKNFKIHLTVGGSPHAADGHETYSVCSLECLHRLIYVHEKDIIKNRRPNKEKST